MVFSENTKWALNIALSRELVHLELLLNLPYCIRCIRKRFRNRKMTSGNSFSRDTIDNLQSRATRRHGIHRHASVVHDRLYMRLITQVFIVYIFAFKWPTVKQCAYMVHCVIRVFHNSGLDKFEVERCPTKTAIDSFTISPQILSKKLLTCRFCGLIGSIRLPVNLSVVLLHCFTHEVNIYRMPINKW